MSRTRIVIFQMKEIIYTAVFVGHFTARTSFLYVLAGQGKR